MLPSRVGHTASGLQHVKHPGVPPNVNGNGQGGGFGRQMFEQLCGFAVGRAMTLGVNINKPMKAIPIKDGIFWFFITARLLREDISLLYAGVNGRETYQDTLFCRQGSYSKISSPLYTNVVLRSDGCPEITQQKTRHTDIHE